MSKTNFYNILVNLTSTNAALDLCNDFFQSKSNRLYFINAHCYNIACKNPSYKKALNNAELVMNDGIGVKIAFKLKKTTVPENMNGTDFIPKLIERCAILNKKVYLLGAKEGIAKKAKKNLINKIDNVQIVGCHSGYIGKDELTSVIDEINML
ncbi:MAG: WecB/TagA/CpsF family glycosyltransferase, partial [Bacteroidales bacterium]|nr:WecB/TagA/CpsF family glycosyltransferase [Bacteroidales bacterium]